MEKGVAPPKAGITTSQMKGAEKRLKVVMVMRKTTPTICLVS